MVKGRELIPKRKMETFGTFLQKRCPTTEMLGQLDDPAVAVASAHREDAFVSP